MMKGIEGQAARGSDSLITTTDLKLYLDRAVADATGNLQNPNIDGNPHQRLFTYNRDLLALSGRDHASSAGLVASNAKGTAEGLGPDVALLYRHYLGYLGEGRLIWGKDPSDTLNCARHLYWQLIGKEGAESIRASLRSSLISALQRKTQDELDEYVKGKLLKFSSQEALGEILYLRGLIDPSYKLYDYVMARAYFMQSVFAGNKREKIRLLKKTLQLEPDAPYALNQLGYVYNVLQQQDSARYWYQKALAAAPRWAFVYNNIGNVYYDLKDYDRALLDYRQAMRLDSTYANPCEGSGLVYHELKQDDKALLYYARAIRLDSSYAVSYKNIGDLYYDEKKYPLALSNFQRALQLDSMDAVVYNAIGNVKAEQQANQAALGFYRRAVWLDSAYATPYQNIGKIYVDLQLPDSAAVYYRRALNLDSTRTSAYNSLGNIDWDRKDFDGALACFKKAAQLAPDSVDYLLDVSLTYLYKQDETRARLWLKSALKLPVLKAETAYNLACVYSRLQETTTGLKYLALALEKGYNQYDDTQQDEDLANIRKTPGFSILIRQYFPGKVKNK
jgi:tetratricopeptide (TPR) repeat protein